MTNGPTETANNLVKRIKRIGFGFRRFAHYWLRVLLYAGRPTGTASRPSHPAELRRADLARPIPQRWTLPRDQLSQLEREGSLYLGAHCGASDFRPDCL